MNKEAAEQKIERFLSDFDHLTNAISWGVDKRIRLSIAAQFMTSEKECHAKQFLEVSDYIKKGIKWSSNVRPEMRHTIGALLISQFSDPFRAFDELKVCYEELVMTGFRKGPYTFLAAYIMLSHQLEDQIATNQADRALEIYKAMKSRHFFLTSNDDYPLAVLLSQIDCNVDVLMEDIEFYYQFLGNLVFRKGNDLQFLSHILTYSRDNNREALAENCVGLFEEFRKNSVKIKGMHYPAIGVLTLLKNPDNAISDILAIYSLFKEQKQLRWYKDMCFLLAIQLYVQDKIDNNDILSIGIASNIQAILQAQEASSIAAISAATASAANSSSS